MTDDNDELAFMTQVMREQYENEQNERDLPAHKQSGYAERMYELADMRRKEQRENLK